MCFHFRFKFNPALAANFDARWLPETFLVLLERLLNKTPSMRPTCEKIAEAIRNGKVILLFLFINEDH